MDGLSPFMCGLGCKVKIPSIEVTLEVVVMGTFKTYYLKEIICLP